MSTIDLSRDATNFRKHYSGVQMQQGRVLTDDDFNEHARIDQEQRRRELVRTIGQAGSQDEGFRVVNPTSAGGTGDFTVRPGTFFLGGMQLELETAETYRVQRDALQQGPEADIALPAEGQSRFDLVYLEAWEQPVTAVEDSELFEVGLGGPDTSVRMRSMRRVQVASDVKSVDCDQGWQEVKTRWGQDIAGLNSELELRPNGTLTVNYNPDGARNDLCSPAVTGGYLGADNQTIRIRILDYNPASGQGHFIWGFDNAAPLFRVRVEREGGRRSLIRMITEPKDTVHWPMLNQVVEILPWSAVLPNRIAANGSLETRSLPNGTIQYCQKVASRGGFLAVVNSSYNPATKTFKLVQTVPEGFGEAWKMRPDAVFLGNPATAPDEYLYLRIWNRGTPVLPVSTGLPFRAGSTVQLTGTGLSVTFNNNQFIPDDFWIIAARPESAEQVVPWQFDASAGRRPHGYRRFRAPLAVIRWHRQGGVVTGEVVDDCREHFPPLTNIQASDVGYHNEAHQEPEDVTVKDALDDLFERGGGCCDIVINPGVGWERAFDRLGDRRDAHICFKSGTYRTDEGITLKNKGHLKIIGAGGGTRIIANKAESALRFEGCKSVIVRDLYAESGLTGSSSKKKTAYLNGTLTFSACPKVSVECVELKCAAARGQGSACITVRDAAAYNRSGEDVQQPKTPVESVLIRDCTVAVGNNQNGVLLVNVNRSQVENNVVRVVEQPSGTKIEDLLQDTRYRARIRKLLISGMIPGSVAGDIQPPSFTGKVNGMIRYGGHYVQFMTSKSLGGVQNEWQKLMDAYPPKEEIETPGALQRYLGTLTNKVLLDEGVRKRFGAFRDWFERVATQTVASGTQGVVVAGRIAREHQILNNTFEGFLQGIHIGVSHKESKRGKPDTTGFLTISGNTVAVRATQMNREACHGIFVGNCESLMMENNYIYLDKSGLVDKGESFGIKAFGYLGQRLIVRHNHLVGFQPGVLIKSLSTKEPHLWLALDNVAVGAKGAIESAGAVLRNDAATDCNVPPQEAR